MDLDPQDRIIRRIEAQNHRALGVLGKLDQVEFFADIDAGNVHVGVPVEFEDHLRLPGTRYRADAVKAPHHADSLLDGAGEQRFDFFGSGVFVVCLYGE